MESRRVFVRGSHVFCFWGAEIWLHNSWNYHEIHQHVWEVVLFCFCKPRSIEIYGLHYEIIILGQFVLKFVSPTMRKQQLHQQIPIVVRFFRQHHDNGVDQVSSCVKSFEEVGGGEGRQVVCVFFFGEFLKASLVGESPGRKGNLCICITTRWFKVTFLSPSWRSLNLWKGHLTIPKRPQRIAR